MVTHDVLMQGPLNYLPQLLPYIVIKLELSQFQLILICIVLYIIILYHMRHKEKSGFAVTEILAQCYLQNHYQFVEEAGVIR